MVVPAVNLFLLLLIYSVLLVPHLKFIAKTDIKSFSPVFSSKSFMVSDLAFQSLIYFKLIFVSNVRSRGPILLIKKNERGLKIRNKRGDITTDTTEILQGHDTTINNSMPTNWTFLPNDYWC